MIHGINNMLATRGVWKPKTGGVRVGREVGALTATGFSGATVRKTTLAAASDVTFSANIVFDHARNAAKAGFACKNFRNVDVVSMETEDIVADASLYRKGDWEIGLTQSGLLEIRNRDATGEFVTVQSLKIQDDTRISWEDGKPTVLTGREARIDGKLAATGDDQILIRKSGCDVQAGDGGVVLNLGTAGGAFSGGRGVTFLGAYQDAVFSDMASANFAGFFDRISTDKVTDTSFSGVFIASDLVADKGTSTFSGYFEGSTVTASDDWALMSGLFLDGCLIRGSDKENIFSGRFIASEITGGEGEDSFGYGTSTIRRGFKADAPPDRPQVYEALEADFIHSSIDAGGGDDSFHGVMWGGELNLARDGNQVRGVFTEAQINSGDGDDTIVADFAHNSVFHTGQGNDTLHLVTAIGNQVRTGTGYNDLQIGSKQSRLQWQQEDGQIAAQDTVWSGSAVDNVVVTDEGNSTVRLTQDGVVSVVTNIQESLASLTYANPSDGQTPSEKTRSTSREEADLDNSQRTLAAVIQYKQTQQYMWGDLARTDPDDVEQAGMRRFVRRYADGQPVWTSWNEKV